MTSKTFTSGTTIDSAWLNDVNSATYSGGAVYTPGGAGRVPTTVQSKLRESVSVKDFGAVGDGITNDSVAIQAAITYAQTIGAGVFLPAATYYCGSTGLLITASIHLYGSNGATLSFASGFSGTALSVNATYVKLSDFVISGPTSVSIPSVNAVGIDVLQAHCVISKVRVISSGGLTYQAFSQGARLAQWSHLVTGCTITGHLYGINSNVANAVNIHGTGCSAADTVGGAGILMNGGSGNSIQQCDIEGSSFAGIYLSDGGTAGSGHGSCAISGCYIESQTSANIYILGTAGPGKNVSGVSITGCYLSGTSTTLTGIQSNRTAGLCITGNEIIGQVTNSINIGSISLNCFVAGNDITGSVAAFVNAAATGFIDTAGGTTTPVAWTPIDSSGAALTFTSPVGTYTRLGKMIFWNCALLYPVTADGSNSLIGGLPFTIPAGTQNRGGLTVLTDATTTTMAMQVDGTTTIRPYKNGLVRAINSDLSNKTLYLSGSFSL